MTTKRHGELEKALTQLNQFLARYPNSPLMPNARVERFRLLERLGRRGEAAVAAREYMVHDPDGFARDEARTLALPSTPSTHP
jgi:TolA-binding protein